ncbi:hypothetical protein EDD16DRAFT_1522477 [Pisolithus croceorrhizus]|nr:hypothetical protein EV401DRAFT_1893942 [Pisolithus croceorrhizus]KAI6109441.1 hypothetical protein EDD16DRAFT_1522477 [Pisolithus croceorrhizus]KAI6152869.1 hypothetical protein EDD17DRAFT_1513151 [Pisolithus thermaeus]
MSIVTLAVDVLNMLTRMEYELVGDELHRMLGAIVNLPPPLFVSATDAVQGLLSNLLDYHPKTRTPVKSVSLQFLPVLAHDVMFSSLSSHLSLLARALRMALTPTQSAELGPVILEELRCAWKAYATKRGSNRRGGKRGKTYVEKGIPVGEHINVDGAKGSKCHLLAVVFSLVARVSGHGIACDEVGKLGWDIVWECIGHGRGERQGVAPQNEDDNKYSDSYMMSVLGLYESRARQGLTLGQSDILGGDEVEELSCVVRDESTKPELVLEIIRTLFLQVSQTRGSQRAQASTIVKTSIDILTRNFSPQSRCTVAPEEVLHKFAPLLLSIPLEPSFETTEEFDSRPSSHCDIFPHNILLLALKNAQFWELRNI